MVIMFVLGLHNKTHFNESSKTKKYMFCHCSKVSLRTINSSVPTDKFRDLGGKCSVKLARTPNLNLCPDLLVSALIGSCSFSTFAPVFWSKPMMVQRVQRESALKISLQRS